MPRAKKSAGNALATVPDGVGDQLLEIMADAVKRKQEGGPGGHFSHVEFVQSPEANTVLYPPNMSLKQLIHWAEQQIAQDEMPVDILMEFDAYPVDGAVALERVLRREYNDIQFKPEIVMGFMGPEVHPPKVLTVKTGVDTTTQAHWGLVTVPNVDGYLKTDCKWNGRRLTFQISGQIKHKDRKKMDNLEALIREQLREESIFRGKAFRVSFREDEREDDPTGGKYKFDPMRAPEFMRTSSSALDNLVFSAKLQDEINASVYGPVKYTESFRANGLPLKAGILAAGPFGTGKTLLANAVAYLCERSGWTYINVKDVRDLDCAFELARQYQPAVVFGEDIDRAVKGDDRSAEIDRILNTIDGVDAKGVEIITILTTNAADDINQAMMRPGRIDVLLNIDPPDREAALRLVRQYGGQTIEEGLDDEYMAAIEPLTQLKATASVYQEVTGRSIKANVVRQCMEAEAAGEWQQDRIILAGQIKPVDLKVSANSMMAHMDFLKPKKKAEKSPLRDMGVAIGAIVARELTKNGVADFRDDITPDDAEYVEGQLAK